jgi:Amt family ammonium transporter
VHLACGVWGVLAVGLFAEPSLTPFAGNVKAGFGGLFIPGGSADILITQIIGSAATIAWVAVTSFIMFGALRAVKKLRVPAHAETAPNFVDAYEHGQTVWPDVLPLPDEAAVKHGAGD